eukprot:4345416-Amphidinium_carterae.1
MIAYDSYHYCYHNYYNDNNVAFELFAENQELCCHALRARCIGQVSFRSTAPDAKVIHQHYAYAKYIIVRTVVTCVPSKTPRTPEKLKK